MLLVDIDIEVDQKDRRATGPKFDPVRVVLANHKVFPVGSNVVPPRVVLVDLRVFLVLLVVDEGRSDTDQPDVDR